MGLHSMNIIVTLDMGRGYNKWGGEDLMIYNDMGGIWGKIG